MTYTKKAPGKGAYTKARREADTAEMLAAINRNADREEYARRCARYEDVLLAQAEMERRGQRWSLVCMAIGAGEAGEGPAPAAPVFQ